MPEIRSLALACVAVAACVAGTLANHVAHRRSGLSQRARSFSRALPPMAHEIEIGADGSARGRSLQSGGNTSVVCVCDFGAVGDGHTDNSAAFQAALNAVGGTGGIVFAPAGQYVFLGSITVPIAVSLVGTYVTVPSHEIDQGRPPPTDGTVLMPRGGRGNDTGTPFITLSEDCTLRGLTIFYPDQDPTQPPAPYPWTITLTGNNPAVTDVELLNSWNGIQAVQAARHYIARVQGQPVNIGIFVDQTYDIGRIEDVHWNPWYSTNAAYIAHQTVYGQGFVIARTDWEYVLNTFVFAMSIGYHFTESSTGSCNGNFVGIGADCCQNASVWVDAADPWGIMIANGEFTSFAGTFGPDVADHTQVVVTSSNGGAVRFVNSAFWGPSNQIAKIAGSGSVGFDNCIFNTWDAVKQNRAAIQVSGGNIMVRGCEFQHANLPQVVLNGGTSKAVVTGNIIAGPALISNNGATVAVIENNAADS